MRDAFEMIGRTCRRRIKMADGVKMIGRTCRRWIEMADVLRLSVGRAEVMDGVIRLRLRPA
jgi:hypothetical protein